MTAPPAGHESWAHEVDVSRIEADLVKLLRRPENLSPNGQPGMRTAVLTLVAFAADRPTLDRVEQTLAALVDHHPSRTIVVLANPTAPAQIDAWVQVSCRPMGSSGINACVDEIVIEAQPSALRRVPNVVTPLLLADLPVVVWWPGEPPLREPLLADLIEPATRLVVDTLGFVHVERSLINLSNLRHRPTVRIDLGDLNWDRLLPWRELIAQFWDVPAWRSRLRALDRVEIDLGKPAGGRSNRAQALLLAGWLAAQLGWRPAGMTRLHDGYRLRAMRGRREITVRVTIHMGQPSGIRAVRFVVESRSPLRFGVHAGGDAETAFMRVEAGDEPMYERTARLETFDEPALLARELDTTTADQVFEDALSAAAAFLTA
ncbi:MAG TPA: glucose-6-phosphate dehydrogenase assembly protein OpcA [Chloroflexota bacterium]|nr:glucose-6-phosphate dehydrogenase assembly protein OpcA [Chloroflexota bacterium]